MAIKCGCARDGDENIWTLCAEHQAYVDRAVQQEREECAKLAERMAVESKIANFKAAGSSADAERHNHYRTRATEIAQAIRARSTA